MRRKQDGTGNQFKGSDTMVPGEIDRPPDRAAGTDHPGDAHPILYTEGIGNKRSSCVLLLF